MSSSDICSTNIVNQQKVDAVAKALALEELCVCDLTALIDVSISAISHQLRLLRNLNLVKFRKSGKMAYYSLDDAHVTELINITREHVAEK